MRNWERCFIQISILFLIKVPHIQTGCKRETQKYCSIKCEQNISMNPEKIEKILELLNQLWSEHPDCQDDGIDLNLELYKFPNDIMKANFLTTQWKVRELSISFILSFLPFISNIKTIEVNAFNVNALKSLKKLVLNNLNVSPISKGIFNGLESLEVLNIKNAINLMVIEEGVLDVLNQTLQEFSLEEQSSSNEILIDGLTGSKKLEKLENVKFRYKLQTSIGQKSFTGLTNTKILDLSECQIKTIEVGAFDPMIALDTLKLENNLITTIPDGFFKTILIRNRTQIFLAGNKWLCDCSLMPFKFSLMEHSNFVGELKCFQPEKFKSHAITVLNFCDSTTTPTTSLTTPYAPMQVCTSPEDPEFSENVVIEPQKQTMEVLQTDDGDVILRADNPKENRILIWFLMKEPISYFNESIDVNCQIASGTSFQIKNLMINSVYNFCLLEPSKMTISPLDCITYIQKSDSQVLPWLLDGKKGRIIGITSVACGLSIVLGILIGILVHKLKMISANKNENFIRRVRSSRVNSMTRSRLSVMTSDSYNTRRTTNTTVQYFLEGNYDAPPLPARPASMYLMDEPVYATIRDIASIRDGTQESVLN